jgi:signal transduction histidine kinase
LDTDWNEKGGYMLHKLKKRLIILNTAITGLILNIVIIGAIYININQIQENSLNNFSNLRETIAYNLQTNKVIIDNWLAQLEASNQMIIHIEDNGTPLLFNGSWHPFSSRISMIEKVKNLALSEGVNTNLYSKYLNKNQSSIFQFTDHNIPVYSCVSLIPAHNGFISLILIQYQPKEHSKILCQIFLYLIIDIFGLFAFFLVSLFFVNKTMKPVEESNQRQNEFIASASHDLRSPLAVIQTNATALLIEGASPKQFVPIIVKECTRMSRLLRDLLILASSDAKTWSIQKRSIDTDTYLAELFESFSLYCRERKHHLTFDIPSDPLPPMNADKDRLTQILGILIDNAISYSPQDSMITLRPYIKKSFFYLEVQDHGIGIKNEQKEFIFNRFYQVDKSRNDTSHFGLGLSVAKELIELQSGKISLKDTSDGGSTFIIELPL